jgi:hypothetical protein
MNTKHLLIAAATALALVVPAVAAEPTIPTEFRGEWCETGRPFLTQRNKVPAKECDAVIALTATKMLGGEDGNPPCQLTKISRSRSTR